MGEMTAAPTSENWVRLHEALQSARLLVPIRDANSTEFDLVVEGASKSPRFLAFTDEEAFNAWVDTAHDYAEMSARELCALVVAHDGEGLVINPAGPAGGMLARGDVELVAEGALPTADGDLQVDGGASIQLWRPQLDRGSPLAESISAVLREAGIASCLVLDGSFGGGQRHRLVGLLPDAVASNSVAQRFAKLLQPAVPSGEIADVVVLPFELVEQAEELGVRIDAEAAVPHT
ncbi:MAG TPA: SseB family protein [Gaiellaceae bacterium]|jgi:hypothetical protein|nr:SseB family protein [Gaiellaceae bacterium]